MDAQGYALSVRTWGSNDDEQVNGADLSIVLAG
jgi:hypothetical protein